jgi:hypothetical protein
MTSIAGEDPLRLKLVVLWFSSRMAKQSLEARLPAYLPIMSLNPKVIDLELLMGAQSFNRTSRIPYK